MLIYCSIFNCKKFHCKLSYFPWLIITFQKFGFGFFLDDINIALFNIECNDAVQSNIYFRMFKIGHIVFYMVYHVQFNWYPKTQGTWYINNAQVIHGEYESKQIGQLGSEDLVDHAVFSPIMPRCILYNFDKFENRIWNNQKIVQDI